MPDIYEESGDVDVSKVVGHSQGYGPLTWYDLISGKGTKRIARALRELSDNPDYYLSFDKKKDWSFIEVEDRYYICTGKHRTAVLRYFAHFNPQLFESGPVIKGVDIIRRKIDYELESTIKRIRRLLNNSSLSHLRFGIVNGDRESRRFYLANEASNFGYLFIDREQLCNVADHLEQDSTVKRIFGKGYSAYFRKHWFLPW